MNNYLIKKSLTKGKEIKTMLKGRSMFPAIRNEEIVITRPDRIKLGDIVFVEIGGRFITHRVVFLLHDKVLLKGDNLKNFDGFFPKEKILGKISRIGTKSTVSKNMRIKAIFIAFFSFTYGGLNFLLYKLKIT